MQRYSMTPEQIDLVKKLLDALWPFRRKLAGQFYGRFFELAPDTAPLTLTVVNTAGRPLLSETLRPSLGIPESDGNARRYGGRDRWLRPLRWEMGWVRECITNECCDGADRRLSTGAVDCPIHLCDNRNRDGRADNPANRGEECMLETERSENISARHYEKTGKPCPSELFSRWASKPIRAQMIKCVEDADLEASHR